MMQLDSLFGKWLLSPVLALALFTYLGATPTVNGQTAASERIVVTGDDVTSAYGAPGGFSRARFSPTTSAYVLPPWTFYFGEIYEGDAFRHGLPDHLFTQEVQVGLPYRFGVAAETELERFNGGGGFQTISLTGRYALADWNKIPLNPTVFAEYKFGIGHAIPDAAEFGVILSHDFRHMVEWAMNWSVEQEVNGNQSTAWGFAQSVEVPVLLPEERLEVGVEMQYRHAEQATRGTNQPRGFVIGPTLAWRPTKSARFDFSPLFGCTGESP